MIAVARFITLTILLGFPSQLTPVFARASSFEDKTWDAENVSVLPPEVRKTLTRMCGPDLVAQAYFAGYFANSKVLVLNFGRLRCGKQTAICTQGRCLHQVYGRNGDHYHLLKSYFGPDDDYCLTLGAERHAALYQKHRQSLTGQRAGNRSWQASSFPVPLLHAGRLAYPACSVG